MPILDIELAIDHPPPGGVLYTMIFWNYIIYKTKWHMLALCTLGH